MHSATTQHRLIKSIACALLVTLSLAPLTGTGETSRNKILLVNSSQDTLYQEYAALVQRYVEELGKGQYSIEITSLNRLAPQFDTRPFGLIVTSGARAAEQLMARTPGVPLLATFIQSNAYHSERDSRYRCQAPMCTILFLDQPAARQLRFVQQLFPGNPRLGLLNRSGDKLGIADYEQRAVQYKIRLVPIRVQNSDDVVDALQKSVADIDVLLAHPDTQLINRNTAKGILLTTYYNRVPLLAYSSSFVKAGATAGLYSTPDDLARHAAETILQLVQGHATPRTAYPKYFRVEINTRVSESLGLNLPSVDTIMDNLRHD